MNVFTVLFHDHPVGDDYNLGVYSTKELAEKSVYAFLDSTADIGVWEAERGVSTDNHSVTIYYDTMDPDIHYSATIESFQIDSFSF